MLQVEAYQKMEMFPEGKLIVPPLRAAGPVVMAARNLLQPLRRRENLYSLAPTLSYKLRKRALLSWAKTVTAFFSKRTQQLWSQSGPIPIKLRWKLGMMWPVTNGSWARGTSQDADERLVALTAVPTRMETAPGLMLVQGSLGVR